MIGALTWNILWHCRFLDLGGTTELRVSAPDADLCFNTNTHTVPEVPDAGHAVLSSCVHPAAVFVEAHRRDVLADAVIVDHWIGVVGVQVVHADVLIT